MATQKEAVEFILGKLRECARFTVRGMFGEYALCADGIMGSAAAPAAVRHAPVPNMEAPGPTGQQWICSTGHAWAARARPAAPEAGALPKPIAWFRLGNGLLLFVACKKLESPWG